MQSALFRTPYFPHVIVFLSSAFIMILEIVAGRLIARHLGNSLYTWTSVIGIILAGMSIGNYLGGLLSDRYNPFRLLGWWFLSASLLTVAVLPLNLIFSEGTILNGLIWPVRTALTVLLIFGLPAILLGAINPTAANIAITNSLVIGRTIGSVYAWGGIGSILGTFLAGFWLIAILGAKEVILLLALLLSLLSLIIGTFRYISAIWSIILLFLLLSVQGVVSGETLNRVLNKVGAKETQDLLYAKDSNYQYITVWEEMSEADYSRTLKILALDHLIHGYIDVNDPAHLEYPYERIYRDVLKRVFPDETTVDSLFIGGGSYTFPRWILHNWPGSRVEVSEIDPKVVDVNYDILGLPLNTAIHTYRTDARLVMNELPKDKFYDLIVGDAFNDLSVPYHLTTLEFDKMVAKHLSDRGIYLVNIIDDWNSGLFISAYTATLQKVFRHVWILNLEKGGIQPGRQTFVIAASNAKLDLNDVHAGHSIKFEGSVLGDDDMEKLKTKSRGIILTDNYSPVENLLEPVVRKRK